MKSPSHQAFIRVTDHSSGPGHITLWLAALFSLAAALCLQATVLDNFDGATRTGWTDTPNGGHLTQSGGQLQVVTTNSTGALTYGTKTSQSFANAVNQTLEFRVDVNAVTPGAGDPNPAAVLAWLPSGAVPGGGSSGYSLWVTAGGAMLKKGSTTLATASYTAAATNNQNTTLVLRMTPAGGNISVNARVYRQTGALPMQTNTIVWETTQSIGDSVGIPGNAALGTYSGASAAGASVSFDNLQVFALQNTVLDDFSGGPADLVNYSISGNGTATISGGVMQLATPTYNNTIYKAARRTSPNYEITDGSRLEISVDVMTNATGPLDPNAFGSLSYTPFNSDAGVGYLIGYHIGAGCYGLSMGKAYAEWWVNQEPYPYYLSTGSPIPGTNVRLIISMTGEGTSIRIDSRVEDLNVGVNDPARLLYQNVFVDTAAADPLDTSNTPNAPDGYQLPFGPAAFLGQPGSIALYAFFGGNATDSADITYDNLVVNQTTPANLPPSFSNVAPPDRSNFVATAASQVSFQVTDDVNIPASNVSLTLNGVTYADGAGATVTGTTASKTFTLNAPLAPDTFYRGSIQATDNVGAVTIQNYSFDTFRTNTCYVVESEDYNYGTGQYIEPYSTPVVNQYLNQMGTEGVDFHDSRTSPDGGNIVYRPDPVRNNITGDGPRPKYAGASPAEIVLVDRQNGDWNNYTHLYPAGWYTAYIRLSQYVVPISVIELDRVTSDPTQPNQTTVPLGIFLGTATGYDIHHDVPLTDAFGNLLPIHFSGAAETLRVNNVSVQATSSELWQNYLVFAPAAAPGSLPPYVATVSPLPGAVLGSSGSPSYSATIVNRDSSVDTASVIMQINGAVVASSVTPAAGSATVTWTPTGTTATFTNTLIFKDNLNVWQTNTWTYTYGAFLRAANSLPVGSLTVRGFDARMAQSDNGGINLENSLNRALQQLAIPPLIPIDRTATSMVQVLSWNKASAPPDNVPGLCAGNYINIAVESLAYLELTAGVHRFRVQTDDRAGLYSGVSLLDASAVALWENPGNTADSTFDFVVEATGLYPARCIWEETGGGAILYLRSVNLNDATQVLINDPTDPPGVVKAWYPIVCQAASSVIGPYTVASTATHAVDKIDITSADCSGTVVGQMVTSGRFTVPISGTAQFYRLDGPRLTKITNITKVGSDVVIAYQVQ